MHVNWEEQQSYDTTWKNSNTEWLSGWRRLKKECSITETGEEICLSRDQSICWAQLSYRKYFLSYIVTHHFLFSTWSIWETHACSKGMRKLMQKQWCWPPRLGTTASATLWLLSKLDHMWWRKHTLERSHATRSHTVQCNEPVLCVCKNGLPTSDGNTYKSRHHT